MVLPEIFSAWVEATANAVWNAGQRARKMTWKNIETDEKGDEHVGHHAIVMPADKLVQSYLLRTLGYRFPDANFITEEKLDKPPIRKERILTDATLNRMRSGVTFGIDPIDGSSTRARKLYEYGHSVGVALEDELIGGSIDCPRVGIQVVGETGIGAWFREDKGQWQKAVVQNLPVGDRYIMYGPDITFMPQFNTFVNEFSRQVRTTTINGSCVLGLALLAAGKIDAFIQPVQCPWDYFAGAPIVHAAGGVVQFYHYRSGKITLVTKPGIADFSPSKRALGFIAGHPKVVRWLIRLLRENWKETDPAGV